MSKVARVQLAVIVGFVALLEMLTRAGAIDRLTMIPPSAMATHLWTMLVNGELNAAMAQTFANVAIAFALSVAAGFASGAAIHALPRLRRLCDPLLASYYAVPFFVFYPLLIAIFGLNRWPLIAIGFVFGAAAMVIATLNGLDRVPRVLRKVALVHRLGRGQEVFHIILPPPRRSSSPGSSCRWPTPSSASSPASSSCPAAVSATPSPTPMTASTIRPCTL